MVGLAGLRRSGVPAGADRPHGLVGEHHPRQLLAGNAVETFLDLPIEHRRRLVAIALVERFADADDRHQTRGEGGMHLLVDDAIGLAEQPASLGVSDDDESGAGFTQHGGADFTGERAFALPVQVLTADADGAAFRRFRRGRNRRERRCDHYVRISAAPRQQGAQFGDVRRRFGGGLEHLEIAGDERRAHHFLSGNAATPGSSAPPRNSSDAPPPVEMCVIRSVTPAALIAATESPPPIIVVPSTPATALATASVPFANGATSNTPIGPFHTTVLASLKRPE